MADTAAVRLNHFHVQVKFEPGAPLFSVHTELLTADGNTCRVSVGNIFKAENLKASQWAVACGLHHVQHGGPSMAQMTEAVAGHARQSLCAVVALNNMQLH